MANEIAGLPNKAGRPCRIGDWVLDTALNELRRGETAVRLEPRAIEVLAFLVQHHGEVVSRDALLSALWPGSVVGDDSLTQAVIKLRRALQDDAQAPRYIETIPKRGYRLIAALGEVDASPEPAGNNGSAAERRDTPVPDVLPPPARSVRWHIGFMVLGVSVALISAIILLNPAQPRPAATGQAADARQDSPPLVAVLPLANLSRDPERDYFSDGISGDIIAALGRFSSLRVMSSNAVALYKGRQVPPQTIRRELGARYVASGSLRESDGTYRVSVELADADKGIVLWSGKFDGTGSDIFQIQDRIVLQVVGALASRVGGLEQERALASAPESLAAYDQVLRARALLQNADRVSNRNARHLLGKAIELAPNYGEAHLGLGQAEHQRAMNGWVEDADASLSVAERHLQRAIAGSDPGSRARAHGELSMILAARGQLERALVEADAALDTNPSDAFVHDRRGIILMYLGRLDDAIAAMKLAARLDPAGRALSSEFSLALANYLQGHYGEALHIADRALERFPGAADLYAIRAAALAQMQKPAEAKLACDNLRRFNPYFDPKTFGSRLVVPEQRAHLLDGLRKAGV